MYKILLIIGLLVVLCGCGTTRKVQTTVADTTATASELVTAASTTTVRDSSVAVSAAFSFDSVQFTETVTTETYDTAGNLRQRTTIERHLSRNRHTEHHDSTAAAATITSTDTATTIRQTTTEHHTATTIEPVAKHKPLRIRYWLLIMLALTAAVAFFRYKQHRNG